ncbi:MAG: T9SS type A sorting domain-containing protein [Candidatus Stahlbacteria bacterium]|nr:T9SS type A sorting domain-containing protein [Candidatus Stahlbacteria bacterium]
MRYTRLGIREFEEWFKIFKTHLPVIGKTDIKFSVNKGTKASLKIYNLGGQFVTTLIDGNMLPGVKSVGWDGRDDSGKLLPVGIYFYELKTENMRQTKKLILLR